MRSGQTIILPVAKREYNEKDEHIMRRTVEQSFEDIRFDIIDARDKTTSPASLALRRFQFLLMGA